MKIVSEISISNFEAWSGGKNTQERIIEEGCENQFDSIIEELYPDGLTDTELNDLLWFDSDTVFEWLGIKEEDSEENE